MKVQVRAFGQVKDPFGGRVPLAELEGISVIRMLTCAVHAQ